MPLTIPVKEKTGPHITVRFPISVHAQIVALAKQHSTTVTEVVRALVRTGLECATTQAVEESGDQDGSTCGSA